MRRSFTPSIVALKSENPREALESTALHKRRGGKRPKRAAARTSRYQDDGLDDDEMRDINSQDCVDGDVLVHRAPVLECLQVPPEVVLRRAFKPPIPPGWFMPPEECGLGAQRKGKALGMSSARTPPSALGAYRAVSREEMMVMAEEEEHFPGYEPCVLWEPPAGMVPPMATTPVSAGALAMAPPPAVIRPVVVTPFVGRFLREHQREGVRFMFECVNGLRACPMPKQLQNAAADGNAAVEPPVPHGCILADDMGLGKTLQSITLLYTLLRKGMEGKPCCRRVIVVTPTSLVRNWDNEIGKWVGDRLRKVALADSDRALAIKCIRRFVGGAYEVMVISYDTFRIHAALFEGPDVADLLICDEAHRLKNDATLTAKALDKLQCKRRILLSGTPMQNDLEEFYAMVNFCNPNILGSVSQFRRYYQNPILRGREPDASAKEIAVAAARSAELSEIVNVFILRRTNTLLAKHLPPKLTQVVCVSLTGMQRDMYERVAKLALPPEDGSKRARADAGALNAINALKKICNHPQLMFKAESKYRVDGASRVTAEEQIMQTLEDFFPPGFGDGGSSRRGGGGGMGGGASVHTTNAEFSGKFLLLANMLDVMRRETDERIVIVSNYTQTLDLFSMLCDERDYPYVRLDGGTNAKKRQTLVDRINDPRDDVFVFLLSSKAGGCGLNLIGANRLVLFDPDWNPATDKQAAARVWRDGQKKRCYVYRFVATGTIEEKIYQRQLSKEGLQNVISEDKDMESALSTEQLKQIFTYKHGLVSDTHDLYKCQRCNKHKLDAFADFLQTECTERGDFCFAGSAPTSELKTAAAALHSANGAGGAARRFQGPRVVVAKPPPAPAGAPANGNHLIPARDRPAVAPDAPQVEYPDEGDLNDWSHHIGTESCDDYVLRKAARGLVSFVYGQTIDGEGLARQAMAKLRRGKDENEAPVAAVGAATFQDDDGDDHHDSEDEAEEASDVE